MPREIKVKKQVGTMYRRHGFSSTPNICGNCKHLVQKGGWLKANGRRRYYYKCDLYWFSSSTSSDWTKCWQACGKFEPKLVPSEGDER